MELFQKKYRITSSRAKWWDYSRSAAYFITICTKDRHHYFGNVINGIMHLSEIGEIVNQEWLKSFELRIDMNLGMGEFVVMPNHFHAIIFIGENDYNRTGICRDAMPCVSPAAVYMNNMCCCIDNISGGGDTIPDCGNATYDSGNAMIGRRDAKHCVSTCFGPQSKNLASIIRGFKIGVTKRARLIRSDFHWQSRFHDHIIRNDVEYHRITNYIIANPSIWDVDKFNQ